MAESPDPYSRSPSRSPSSPPPTAEHLFEDEEAGVRRDVEDSSDEDAAAVAGQGDQGQINSDDEEDKKKKEKDAKKAKKPKGPVKRMMISEDLLIGDKGLRKIGDVFKDFEFKGKGREKEDLNRIMNRYEQWIHMLHPKHPFDQCLERIEFLGNKKRSVKVMAKKIRMGMVSTVDEDNARLVDDNNESEFPDFADDDLDNDMLETLERTNREHGTETEDTTTGGNAGVGESPETPDAEVEDLGVPDLDELREMEQDNDFGTI